MLYSVSILLLVRAHHNFLLANLKINQTTFSTGWWNYENIYRLNRPRSLSYRFV